MTGRLQSIWSRAIDRTRREPSAGGVVAHRRRWPVYLIAVAVVLVALWYPIGMLVYHEVQDDPDFHPDTTVISEGGSVAVASAAELARTEAQRWAPNKPFWHPGSMLTNMQNYQLGLMYSISRFAVEMGDQLGRTRGTSAIDPDLDRAAGLLKYDGTIWYWGSGNLMPQLPADSQYEKAADALEAYNRRVAAGRAVYDKRADNLIGFLQRVSSDLGAASAALDDRMMASDWGYLDFRANKIFYNVKGRLYGYYILLRDIGTDFKPVIGDKQVDQLWTQMLQSLRVAVEMSPFMISNGPQDGLLVPSHLSAQGFYLLRARSQMGEVMDSLAK